MRFVFSFFKHFSIPLGIFLFASLGLGGLPLTAQTGQSVYPGVNYSPEIPTPEKVLGVEIGSRPLRHSEVYRYFKTLDEISPRFRLVETARTYEGRQLFYAIISAEDNLNRLEGIKTNLEKLADTRKTATRVAAKKIIARIPGVALMMYSIHGDELSSTDAAVALAYYLAAGEDSLSREIRHNLIVLIDPMENPDGRERYLAQIQQWTGNLPNGDIQSMQHRGMWTRGRGNHYLFDLNRDWFALVHPETRARVKTVLEWHPQMVIDSHEMGAFSSYFFPPPRTPINPYIHPAIRKWWHKLSADQARAFDRHGWSYQSEELFDEWYPGYGSAYPYYTGAVAILYEQARTDGSLVRRPEGTVLTFKESVRHHFISSVANLTTAARNRSELLLDYWQVRHDALKASPKKPHKTYFLLSGADGKRTQELVKKMLFQGIEISVLKKNFKIAGLHSPYKKKPVTRMLPAGTFVIQTRQPLGWLVHSLLDFDLPMPTSFLKEERQSVLRENRSKIYDISGWSLPLAYGVQAYASRYRSNLPVKPIEQVDEMQGGIVNSDARYGYLLDPRNDNSLLALVKFFKAGLRIRAVPKALTYGGKEFPRGALVLRRHENPDSLDDVVKKIVRSTGVNIWAANSSHTEKGPDLGGEQFKLLAAPRIALLTGPGVQLTTFGSLWFALDQELQIKHSLLNHLVLQGTDLRKYNVLIIPPFYNGMESFKKILSKPVRKKLRNWVENGGTLIAIGNAAAFLADTASHFSKVRLRRQVLASLELYKWSLKQEMQLGKERLDSLQIWDGGKVVTKLPEIKKPGKTQLKLLQKEDEIWRRLRPRGAILRCNLNTDHWMTIGMGDKVPVIFNSSYAFLSTDPVETIGRFSDAAHLRLSGLLWPEARARWENTAYLTRESMGKGQLILFADEPFFRAYFKGSGRLFFNVLLFAPGMGTQLVVPM